MKTALLCMSSSIVTAVLIKTSFNEPWWGLLIWVAVIFAGIATTIEGN